MSTQDADAGWKPLLDREVRQGRAHVDWSRGGAIVSDRTGLIIGHADDLNDKTLAAVEAAARRTTG